MQSVFLAIGLLVVAVQPMKAPAQTDTRQLRPYSYYEGPLGTPTAPAAPEYKDEKEKARVKEPVVYYTPGTYWTPSYYWQFYYPATYVAVAAAPVTYYYGAVAAPAGYPYGVVTVGPKTLPEGYIAKTTVAVKTAGGATVLAPAAAPAPAIAALPATVPAPATTYYYGSLPATTYYFPAYRYVWP
jgi:hypothetical protein